MGDLLQCARCDRSAPSLDRPPYPGAAGEEILSRICTDCWSEWESAEVMVINELRLNFMDPGAQDILTAQMRDFLCLGSADPAIER